MHFLPEVTASVSQAFGAPIVGGISTAMARMT